jgi:uncharacterized protein (TIGR00290 family)
MKSRFLRFHKRERLMGKRNVAISWSGGKDSCLALYRALKQGYTVDTLLNFVSGESQRCCFHGVPREIMRMQAQALGIPLVTHPMPDDMKEYEEGFKQAVLRLKNIQGMVFGDIYLDEHKDWVERVCGSLGIACIEPLWNESTLALMEEFVDVGFKAVIVSCRSDLFGPDWIGRMIDRGTIADLRDRGICPCGENGEFHTLVIDGPLFGNSLELTEIEIKLVDGFWKHWFLDIKTFGCKDKSEEEHNDFA